MGWTRNNSSNETRFMNLEEELEKGCVQTWRHLMTDSSTNRARTSMANRRPHGHGEGQALAATIAVRA